jgi:hypothetical protein
MRMAIGPDGKMRVDTYGYERDPDDEFDPFKRAGIERTHHSPSEIEETPTAVFGRFPGGTDPRAAVSEVFTTMFPDAVEVPASGYARQSKHPEAIDADVIEDPPEFIRRPDATCHTCVALMRIFGDDKVDPECPRCGGTGDEPDADPPVPG